MATMSAVIGSDAARLLELQKGQAASHISLGLVGSEAYVALTQPHVNQRSCFQTRCFKKDICISKGFQKRAVGTAGEIQIELLYLH